jgi:hypothetical protein
MKKSIFNAGVSSPEGEVTNVTRRKFITSCSACTACLALSPLQLINTSCSTGKTNKKLNIHILYSLHGPVQKKPDWPNIGFDFNPYQILISKNFS